MQWSTEYRRSIKSWEAEDRIDLLFYRPFGFLVAKISASLRLSPTHLTLAGAGAGLVSGYLFYSGGTRNHLLATLLFLVSGILDSADGQLARLTGQSSAIGLVLDGLCDSIVFSAVYIGCTIPLMNQYGWSIWILAVFAGFCHSLQSSILDFYNREYLYYVGSADPGYWNPLVSEARQDRSSWARLRLTWIKQQELLSTRTPAVRLAMKEARRRRPEFAESYRVHNRRLLGVWRPLGANLHTLAIITFAWQSRFDLYLLLIDVLALNIWMSIACWIQWASDQKLLKEAGIEIRFDRVG